MRHRAPSIALLVLLALPSIGAALKPSCLAPCGSGVDCCAAEPCLAAPCADYLGCAAEAKDAFDTCIQTGSACQPISPGRCTIILRGCVRPCEVQYQNRLKTCRRQAFGSAITGCTNPDTCALTSAAAKRKVAKACGSCQGLTTTTNTTTTTTSTAHANTTAAASTSTTSTTTARSTSTIPPVSDLDRCARQCLQRIPSLASCNKKCVDRCDGDPNAIPICQQACRNFFCLAIKARCTGGANGTGTPDSDPQYIACCSNADTCLARDEAPCEVTTTTTSTTTTLLVTTTVVTSTTTSTSPQPL